MSSIFGHNFDPIADVASLMQLLPRDALLACLLTGGDKVGEGISGVQATVQQVIDHLQSEKQQSHFKSIAAAHADFIDVVESPDFDAYRSALPPDEQAQVQQVVDSGSAQEIIDMLTKFKASKTSGAASDDSIDAAEGVRSAGLTLPSAPQASQDYADAWNEQ